MVVLPDDVQAGDIIECHGVKQRVTYEFGSYALERLGALLIFDGAVDHGRLDRQSAVQIHRLPPFQVFKV